MSVTPEQALVGKEIPKGPVAIPDWKLNVTVGDPPQAFTIDVCEWESANSLFPPDEVQGVGTPNWFAFWKKRQEWAKQTYGIELSVSQVYQIFQYVRVYWNTMKPFFDRDLGLAFGIMPTPGDSESGKSA
jgi:hypothetical protein